MKTCSKCKTKKPLESFDLRKSRRDGRQSYCKACAKEYRQTEGYKNSRKKYLASDKGKAAMKRGWEKFEKTEKGRERQRRTSKTKRLKFPEKAQARLIADRAQRAGTLISEPCSECGDVNVEKHHPDYSQPLKIIWLCRVHHRALHKAENLSRAADNLPIEVS